MERFRLFPWTISKIFTRHTSLMSLWLIFMGLKQKLFKKRCNISTSEGRGRTTIYIDSTILLLEVAGRFSSRCSDRKSRKRQNSTSKQTLNCHGVFSEINSHQSWFLTQTANTLIYFSEKVQKVQGASLEGFQTFEYHLKISPEVRGIQSFVKNQ